MRFIFLISLIFWQTINIAQADNYFKGKVVKITDEGVEEVFGQNKIFQEFDVQIIDSDKKGEVFSLGKGDYSIITEEQKLKVGDKVVLSERGDSLYVVDRYRLKMIFFITFLFMILTVVLGRKTGFMSLVGLALSFFIILKFIVPQILIGKNPLLVSLLGGTLISIFSIYISHGFKKRTTLAVLSTIITFVCAIIISYFFVLWTTLFGVYSEEVIYLHLGLGEVDLKGLLLGGILIGILGILDDVTTSQCAAVEEIYKANSQTNFTRLYKQGISVGKEHMASMINTLALAYAGVSLPLFLLFTLNKEQPLWVILNSEFVAAEIVRTLAGSCSLILAVPISTFLSTYFYTRKR